MSRDIRITPNLGSTGIGQYPEIKFTGISQSFITLKVDDDGSVKYTGTYGNLFSITDSKDGLLHSVNDISGLPILSVYSYDYVEMGKWDKHTLVVNSDKVGVGLTAPSTNLHIYSTQSGAFRLQDTTQVAGYVLTCDANGVGTWAPGGGGGGITGSGTSNYVPYWVTSTQLSSTGSIYDDGTNVGIGTPTPGAKVDIQHTSSSNIPGLNVYFTSGSTNYGTIGASITLDAPTAWAPVALSVTNLSSAQYGIGLAVTSNITGAIIAVNSTTYSYVAVTNYAAGKGQAIHGVNLYSGTEYALTNTGRGILIAMSNNTANISGSDGASLMVRRMRNDTSTSVSLINGDELGSIIFQGHTNTSYANEVSIGSDFVNGVGIKSFINGNPSFQTGTTSMPANLVFYTNDGTISADFAERMRIEYNGNVGINSATPSHKLHIYDNSGLGAFRLQDGTEATKYVLTSDSTGVGTWQPSVSSSSGTVKLSNGQATVTTSLVTVGSKIFLTYAGDSGSGWTFSTAPSNTMTTYTDTIIANTSFQIEAVSGAGLNDTTNQAWIHWLIIN